MHWRLGDTWHVRCYFTFEEMKNLEYKYIVRFEGNLNMRWEEQENHRLMLERFDKSQQVRHFFLLKKRKEEQKLKNEIMFVLFSIPRNHF